MSKKNCQRLFVSWLALIWLLAGTVLAQEQPRTLVTVGGYSFPPYVVVGSDGFSGVVPEMVEALNQLNSDYVFSFVPTSIAHRYQAFSRHRFDILLFESPDWGWQGINKSILPLHIADGEVFVGRQPEASSPGYFDDLQQKRLLLVRGYHYRIVGFETDEVKLRQRFLAELVPDTQAAVEGLLLGRADVAPISQSFLRWYLQQNPGSATKLVISSRWDQQYQHTALLHPESPIKTQQLQALIQQIKASGTLERILDKYHVSHH